MKRMPLLHSSIRVVILLIACTAISGSVRAQSGEGDLIYKFSLQDISTVATAKPVQYAMMAEPFATSCDYIDACACFKFGSNTPIDYATLQHILLDTGHHIVGEVLVSDGTILHPTIVSEGR